MSARLMLAALAVSISFGGCASSNSLGRFLARPVDTDFWTLPAAKFSSQYLFKVKYEGAEGRASFRLTLYLADRSRFRLAAADPFGRKLWTIDLTEEHSTIWLDHRRKVYCLAGSSDEILVPIAELPLRAVPKLLLGYVPGSVSDHLRRGQESLSFLDDQGQTWRLGFSGAELDWWSIAVDDVVTSWWKRESGDAGSFFDLHGGHQLHWRQVVSEVLAGGIPGIEIPARYQEKSCTEL